MSRQNKVNPGMYTQRGRLTQDDASRELRKQSAIRSPHTWQPVNTRTGPRLGPAGDAAREAERSADSQEVETPEVETRPPRRVTRNITATQATPAGTRAKAAKAKSATTRTPKRTIGKARTGKAKTTALKKTTAKPTRTAVPARNAGGRRAAPRSTTQRRKR